MSENEKILNDYFVAAKGESVIFSNEKLRSVVEKAQEPEVELFFNNKRILQMTISTLIVAGALIPGVYWFSQQQSSNQDVVQSTSTDVSTPSTDVKVSSTDFNRVAAPPLEINMKRGESNGEQSDDLSSSAAIPEQTGKATKTEALTISGINAIELSAEELLRFNFDIRENCDLVHIKKGSSGFTELVYSGIEWGTSVRKLSESEVNPWFRDGLQVNPVMITDEQGSVRTYYGDPIDSEVTEKKHPEQATIDGISVPEFTIDIPIYPDDTTWTEKKQRDAQASAEISGGTKITFTKLTPSDVKVMKATRSELNANLNSKIASGQMVALCSRSTENCRQRFLIWFNATLELVRQLPLRYQEPLVRELSKSESDYVLNAKLLQYTNADQEEPSKGCHYLDLCRTTAGAVLQSSVFPNPVQESLTLQFTLSEKRSCDFTLHYLNGILCRKLQGHQEFNAGENNFVISMKDIESGMYLLSMITERGERIVQRVIVKK